MFRQNEYASGEMLRSIAFSLLAIGLACFRLNTTQAQDAPSLLADLAVIKQVGPDAAGFEAATLAAKRLSAEPSSSVASLLASMTDASPLAKNWLRIVAADVADNGNFPSDILLAFFSDRSQDTDARHAAYQMLVVHDPSSKAKLLAGATDDPSLPIRHQSIAMILDEANQVKETDDKDRAKELFRLVVSQGRNPDQLQAAVKALDVLGEKIELADELGLIRRYWAIGTYENTNSGNFATAYPPEKVYAEKGRLPEAWLAANAVIPGGLESKKTVNTKLVVSDDSFGVVNINPTFENAKDVIAYCYVEFTVPEAIEAVAKLGSITASKVWVNGKEVMANEVYHSGSRIDQYIGDCQLVPGVNSALIKICQNAQTEPWAQDWQFQFRFSDQFGAAIKPAAIVQPAP